MVELCMCSILVRLRGADSIYHLAVTEERDL